MPVQIDKITDKYIAELGKKKVLKTVSFNTAVSNLRQVVEETSSAFKKEIEDAIQPFKEKIAQKDEFISQQGASIKTLEEKNDVLEMANKNLKSEVKEKTDFIRQQKDEKQSLKDENKNLKLEKENLYKENQDLKSQLEIKDDFIEKKNKENEIMQEHNRVLNETTVSMKDTYDKYKKVYKEAYRQGITPEIREQKSGLASVLSALIEHKIKPKKSTLKQNVEQIPEIKTEVKPPKPDIKSQKADIKQSKIKSVAVSKSVKTERKQTKKVIKYIENERKNQVIDKARMDKASVLIKTLLEDAPTDTYQGIQEQFKKTKDRFIRPVNNIIDRSKRQFKKEDYGLVRYDYDKYDNLVMKSRGLFESNKDAVPYKYEIFNRDNSSIEIYDGYSDSYIKFKDTEGKDLLHIAYNSMYSHYSIFISDSNGRTMVTSSIENGAVKYMRVNFNKVKSTAEIENDAPINAYTQNLVNKAKEDTVSKTHIYRDTADIYYFNQDGKKMVSEYYVNEKEDMAPPKGAVPIFTYLINPKEEKLEKLISTGDFGFHAKYDKKLDRWIQYSTKGITGVEKYDKEGEKKTFGIQLHRSTDNEHFEVQSLYDEKYKGNNDSWQRPVYEKFNYGLASYPLTKFFIFHDLSQHNIKPWDFSIIKDYIK